MAGSSLQRCEKLTKNEALKPTSSTDTLATMVSDLDILQQARSAARKAILYLPHAVRQMSRPDRMITTSEVRQAVQSGEVIEDYPEDLRGHSCLIVGAGTEGRLIHVVCSPKPEFLAIITAYLPNEDEWEDNFTKRKPK